MKKQPFIVLFIIEAFLALISVGLLLSDLGAVCYLIAIAVFTPILTPFFIKLKKTEDEDKKCKIRRNILLIPLIPIALAIIAIILVVIAMMFTMG